MNVFRTTCAATALAFCMAGSGHASVLWQETFAADPSGVTSVTQSAHVFPLQDLYLQVTGGTFDSVDWYSIENFVNLWWIFDSKYGWILSGNEYTRSTGQEHLSPNLAIFDDVPPISYNNCDTLPRIPWQTCASYRIDHSIVAFVSAEVAATDSFTLTLSDVAPGIPEPSAWTLMVLAVGGLGVLLRNRRRQAMACALP